MTMLASNQKSWIPSLETFASRIAMVRHLEGWNVKNASLACGFPPANWRQWEKEGRLPRDVVSVARQIADRTGADAIWIMTGTASPE